MNDLREWLLDRIDGSEETRGEDSLISGFIAQIDAESVVVPKHPDEDDTGREYVEFARTLERAELADLKQRLLPQFAGRLERAERAKLFAEHERDEMLEKLIAARSATEETAIGHARYEYLRTLNPREFAALYDETLADERFDDLVDRRRMKGAKK